jgi:hypothetical protein
MRSGLALRRANCGGLKQMKRFYDVLEKLPKPGTVNLRQARPETPPDMEAPATVAVFPEQENPS